MQSSITDNKSIVQGSLPDLDSAIKLAESRSIVKEIFYDFCGIMVERNNKTSTIRRISKPTFTYEYSLDLTNLIYTQVNRITARTDFAAEQLNRIYSTDAFAMRDNFTIEGFKNIISPAAWKKAVELLDPDLKAQQIEIDGKKYYQTLWKTKHGIEWDYNSPFTTEMLNIIKEHYDLANESWGQSTKLRNIFLSVRTFIEGGLNRSKEHLTLDHEKVVYKETQGNTAVNSVNHGEGALDKIKKGVNNIFPGGNLK